MIEFSLIELIVVIAISVVAGFLAGALFIYLR